MSERAFRLGWWLSSDKRTGVVVLHGVDYNDSDAYDFGAGVSDLDSSLPAEATDLAACGVLKRLILVPAFAQSVAKANPKVPPELGWFARINSQHQPVREAFLVLGLHSDEVGSSKSGGT